MTPKEKAQELVYKYQYLVNTWDCYNDESLEMIYRLPDMKQCALIAVDEVQQLIKNLSSCKNRFIYIIDEMNYWEEVKHEIQKL
jgi:hypothetical protein